MKYLKIAFVFAPRSPVCGASRRTGEKDESERPMGLFSLDYQLIFSFNALECWVGGECGVDLLLFFHHIGFMISHG